MQENVELFKIKNGTNKKQYEFIDLSGHPSQQYRIKKYCSNIKYVIFIIDSADLQNINSSSKMLYHLLSLKVFSSISPKPKILIICNKTDQPNCSTIITIKSSLIKELNKLHDSTSSLSSVNDGANDDNEIIDILKKSDGKQNGKTTKGNFDWNDINYDITFDTCSVLQKNIDPILKFLQ